MKIYYKESDVAQSIPPALRNFTLFPTEKYSVQDDVPSHVKIRRVGNETFSHPEGVSETVSVYERAQEEQILDESYPGPSYVDQE